MLLSREQILSAKDRKTEDVDVPEWGGPVRIGGMSAGGLLAFRELSSRQAKGENVERDIMGLVLRSSILDADGKEVFAASDVSALLDKSPAVITRLVTAALAINELADANGKPIDAVEEARKNS